ncbi:hypothetical protein LOK49_LG10G00793 [Camellia lanceoleosa]|uniref:Uncharacterized protein n=1 Tax=Camellia lanceoleosa TaxID=1840588 RepID=A0ACC0G8I0_9ERIC|nr:hypothetical protein LOK49_LG10G00793 [Camellia lanceoleosa]
MEIPFLLVGKRWIYFLGILPYATHSVDFLVSLPFPFLSLPSLTLSSFRKMKMQESRYGEETTPVLPALNSKSIEAHVFTLLCTVNFCSQVL